MDSQTTLAVLAMVFSVVSVLLSGWFSIRAARIRHELEAEPERRKQEQSALKAAQSVYEPLAQAAAELQSRIFNIVETGWVGIVKRYESHDALHRDEHRVPVRALLRLDRGSSRGGAVIER